MTRSPKMLRYLFALLATLLAGQAVVSAQGTSSPNKRPSMAATPGEEVTSLPILIDEPTGWLSLQGTVTELQAIFEDLRLGAFAEVEVLDRGALREVRLRGDADLVLDRTALALCNVRLSFEAGPDFADANVLLRRGAGPLRALTGEAAGRVALPTRFLDVPGSQLFGPRTVFTGVAVRPDGAAFGMNAWVQGDALVIGQRTGTLGR